MANYKSLSSHLHKLHQFYFLLQDAYLRNYYQILEEDLSIKGTLFSLVLFYSFRVLTFNKPSADPKSDVDSLVSSSTSDQSGASKKSEKKGLDGLALEDTRYSEWSTKCINRNTLTKNISYHGHATQAMISTLSTVFYASLLFSTNKALRNSLKIVKESICILKTISKYTSTSACTETTSTASPTPNPPPHPEWAAST